MPYNFNAITGKLDLVIDPSTISLGDLNPKDHDLLDGLGDDDHPQYHNDARADTWFSGKDLADLGTKNHADLDLLLADDHTQYFLLAGRAGGQTAYGSPTNGQNLTIAGNPGANPGFINMNSPVIFGPYTGNPSAAYGFDYSVVDNPPGAFIGGGLNMSGTITTAHSTFIYESFRGAPTITTGANPGFAAYTVLQALPQMDSGAGAGHNPLSPLMFNAGGQVRHLNTGTRTVTSIIGVNFATTLVAGSAATLNCTQFIGFKYAPTWNTAIGSIASFGNMIGLDVASPVQAPFGGSSAGIERLSSFYGVKVANPTINNSTGTAPVAALRSAINVGTNRYFLLNAGTAPSDHGAAHMYFDDNFGVVFGGNGITNFDAWIVWHAPTGSLRTAFESTFDSIYQSSPSGDRFLWAGNGGNQVTEFNFNCHKFSLGAQSTNNGNKIGSFVAGTRFTTLDGDWSDMLFTQGGNLTYNHAMSSINAWNINPIGLTAGTGSIANWVATLNIAGMATSNLDGAQTHALRVQGRRTGSGVAAYDPLSPSQLTGDVNNYAPATGNSMRQVWRLDSDASRTITGIAVQQEDDTQLVINIGSNDIVLADENASSTATNRMISPTGVDLTLGPNEYAYLWHDNVTDRWRILETNGS